MSSVAAPVVACVATTLLMPLVIRLLLRLQAIDHPGPRSSHVVATPRGGGLAILVGLCAAAAVAPQSRATAGVLTAAISFGAVGAVEDIRGIEPLPRFGLHCLAGLVAVLVWGAPGLAAGLAAAALLVAYANAFNFMDGINGISVAQASVAGVAYAALAAGDDDRPLMLAALVIASGSLGFLPWNFPRASVFLGDAGSYALGGALMLVAVVLLRNGHTVEATMAPLVLYVADTTTSLARRVRRREAWHLPHRSHVYQRLTDRGWSHPRVTGVVAFMIAACSLLGGLSGSRGRSTRIAADVGVAVVVAVYLALPRFVTDRNSLAGGDPCESLS